MAEGDPMDDLELAFGLYADESTGQISLPNAVRRCHSFLFSQNNHYVFKKKEKQNLLYIVRRATLHYARFTGLPLEKSCVHSRFRK